MTGRVIFNGAYSEIFKLKTTYVWFVKSCVVMTSDKEKYWVFGVWAHIFPQVLKTLFCVNLLFCGDNGISVVMPQFFKVRHLDNKTKFSWKSAGLKKKSICLYCHWPKGAIANFWRNKSTENLIFMAFRRSFSRY